MTVDAPPVGFDELRPPLSRTEALVEADRCLECAGPYAAAPCMLACPARVDVARFVAQIADGDVAGAAETILAENLLGGTCARVCPAEVLCEGACVLTEVGRPPIAIAALQRYAMDAWSAEGVGLRPRAPRNGRRVAVVGAGPAGLACAGELAALGYAVTIYDERAEIGGLVRFAIAPYRQLNEPLPEERAGLERLGVEFRLGTRVDAGLLASIAAGADAVFLGIGLGPDTAVSYPGEELTGVWQSLPFIEALKSGQRPKVGRRVLVIGGGNTAIDVAREALRLGAEHVTVVYRRTEAEMPAYPHEIEEARLEGVTFEFLAEPIAFHGTDSVVAVECRRTSLGEADASGRRRPEPVAGSEFVLGADTVVQAIGQERRRELATWIPQLRLGRAGELEIDRTTGRTANPKFFAGGDAVNGGATAVEAVAEAKRAARAIDEWLRCDS